MTANPDDDECIEILTPDNFTDAFQGAELVLSLLKAKEFSVADETMESPDGAKSAVDLFEEVNIRPLELKENISSKIAILKLAFVSSSCYSLAI